MKLFDLSLEEDVGDWYLYLDDISYKTLDEFQNGFKKQWGEKKEPRHQLVALHNNKKWKMKLWRNSTRNLEIWFLTFIKTLSQMTLLSSFITLKL